LKVRVLRGSPLFLARALDTAIQAVNAITDSQKGRVKEVLHQFLNQPTAMARLRAALVADGIPFTDGELAFVAASLFLPSIAP
jgi:hypothetical protein